MIGSPNIDAFGRLLEHIAGYYEAAPVVWWTLVGLTAFGLACWAYRGRDRKG